MDELFKKRMEVLLNGDSVGQIFVDKTNIIQNKTFCNDQNFRQGMLYDWEMNELGLVDFKFEKKKEFTAEGYEVEYHIQFRPNYNPESLYKNKYFKNDGRERLGFFIDVKNNSKKMFEKWIIVGKDDRVAFDRYNAFKCNWVLEWLDTNYNYHSSYAVIRNASSKSIKSDNKNNVLGGSTINGDMTIIVPTSSDISKINMKNRFIISDNISEPLCFEIINKVDTAPLGLTKLYVRQCLFDPNKDFYGDINNASNIKFKMKLPLPDLPEGFGGSYHMICNCIEEIGSNQNISRDIRLSEVDKFIYVNGEKVTVNVISSNKDFIPVWHIFVDDIEYTVDDLKGYFEITINNNSLLIRSINKVMAKYKVKVAIYDDANTYYDFVEMEVKI